MKSRSRIAGLTLCLLASVCSFAAQVTGTVTNGTTSKPSAGDEVVLLSLVNGMDEVARTKTDSQGHYALKIPDEGAQHLVRVTRQSVAYIKAVPPGASTADVTVYDAATQMEGLAMDARVFHIQASAGSLEVSDLYVLNNQSQPPRSRIGNQTFAVTIPDGAEIGEASITGPSGMPLTVAAVPSGVKNRYAYDFPIRPGQSRFEVFYKMPYSGTHEFSFTPESHLNELGVLLPKSMKFIGISGGFAPDVDEAGLAVFFAKDVPANQEIKFSVSGEGVIQPGGQPAPESSAPSAPVSSGGVSSTVWLITGAIVLLIAGGAFILWRKTAARSAAADSRPAKSAQKARAKVQAQPVTRPEQGEMLDVLKDELFQLERDRLEGKISLEEYEKTKAGLDTLMRRQMKKK